MRSLFMKEKDYRGIQKLVLNIEGADGIIKRIEMNPNEESSINSGFGILLELAINKKISTRDMSEIASMMKTKYQYGIIEYMAELDSDDLTASQIWMRYIGE